MNLPHKIGFVLLFLYMWMSECTLRSAFARYATFNNSGLVKKSFDSSSGHYTFFCMLLNYLIFKMKFSKLYINSFTNLHQTQNVCDGSHLFVLAIKINWPADEKKNLMASWFHWHFKKFHLYWNCSKIWNDKIAFHHQIDFIRHIFPCSRDCFQFSLAAMHVCLSLFSKKKESKA